MSAKNKARVVWIFPVALLASWVAVRTLAASPGIASPPSSPPSTTRARARDAEPKDASLTRLIGRLADEARAQQPRPAR